MTHKPTLQQEHAILLVQLHDTITAINAAERHADMPEMKYLAECLTATATKLDLIEKQIFEENCNQKIL